MKRATAVIAETAHFEGGTQIWCPRTKDSLNLGRNLDWQISYAN